MVFRSCIHHHLIYIYVRHLVNGVRSAKADPIDCNYKRSSHTVVHLLDLKDGCSTLLNLIKYANLSLNIAIRTLLKLPYNIHWRRKLSVVGGGGGRLKRMLNNKWYPKLQ